jgi:hypothetical protein
MCIVVIKSMSFDKHVVSAEGGGTKTNQKHWGIFRTKSVRILI